MTLADNDKQNHRFIEQGRVRGRKILSSLSDHIGSPVDLRVGPRIDLRGGQGRFIPQTKVKICPILHTDLSELYSWLRGVKAGSHRKAVSINKIPRDPEHPPARGNNLLGQLPACSSSPCLTALVALLPKNLVSGPRPAQYLVPARYTEP